MYRIGSHLDQPGTNKILGNLKSCSSEKMFVRLVNPFRLFWRKAHSTMSEGLTIPGPVEKSIHRKVRPLVDRVVGMSLLIPMVLVDGPPKANRPNDRK